MDNELVVAVLVQAFHSRSIAPHAEHTRRRIPAKINHSGSSG